MPITLLNFSFSDLCNACNDMLYIEELREYRKLKTTHIYKDKNGKKKLYIPVYKSAPEDTATPDGAKWE